MPEYSIYIKYKLKKKKNVPSYRSLICEPSRTDDVIQKRVPPFLKLFLVLSHCSVVALNGKKKNNILNCFLCLHRLTAVYHEHFY